MSEKEKAPKLLGKELKEANHVRNVWSANVPAGTRLESLSYPEFWANVSARFRPNDRIEIMPPDGAYFAEFIVRSAGPNWAHVEILRVHKFVSAESVVNKAQSHEIKWGSPKTKFRVWRLSDKTVVKDGFDTPEQAAEWVAANEKAVA